MLREHIAPANVSHVFRLGREYIWQTALLSAFWQLAALLCICILLIGVSRGRHFPVVGASLALLALCGGFGMFVAAILYYVRWRQPVQITPQGIDGFDFKGHRCFVRWSQMHACSPYTAYKLLPCILVRHSEAMWGPLQIPVGIERRDDFLMLIKSYAGPDCELARALT